MKKTLIGLFIIFIAGFMIYFTRPSQTQPQTSQPSEAKSNHSQLIEHNIDTHSEPVDVEKCDSKAMVQALDKLKEERNKALKAIVGDVISAEQLSNVVKRELSDYQLSQEIKPNPQQKLPEQTPEQLSLSEFQQNRKLSEDLMMGALAGQSALYVDKFLAGDLAPLNANSSLHKVFLVNVIAMAGEQDTFDAINGLYAKEDKLAPELTTAIIQGISDPKRLTQLLSRIPDINQTVNQAGAIFGSDRNRTPIQLAVMNRKFAAAQVLLQLGAKPSKNTRTAAMNYFYQVDNDETIELIRNMLNRGFQPTNSSSAKTLASNLKKMDSELSGRVEAIAQQLKSQEAIEFNNLPIEFRQIVETYQAKHEPLNKQYLQCLAQESQNKPKIPPYQSIDKKKVEQEIDLLIAQKVEYTQIIATLAAQNKETVEHGYSYLKRLRVQKNHHLDVSNMPKEVRTLIGLLKDEKWDELIKFMQRADLNNSWEITAGTMIGAMIEKNAPEAAIAAMAEISDKNDIKLLNQAIHDQELLKRIAHYGFNMNATDQSNKNLFYQAVRTNNIPQIDFLLSQGVSMTSDPYGYDAVDLLLRKKKANSDLIKKLAHVGFPVSEDHLDYSLYLKSYYPGRYQKLIESWPDLEVEGQWQPKS